MDPLRGRVAMRKLIFIVLADFAWMCSCAQTTTGALQGKLLSIEGTPVESANLILTGSALLGEAGTFSDRNGTFLFKNLPIGAYKLAITHVSFKTREINDIQVNLGKVTNLGPIKLVSAETQLGEVVVMGTTPVLSSE